VSDALTAALTYTGLRRLAQDRIARDVADSAQSRATSAETAAAAVAIGATLLFAFVVFLGVTVTRSISRPLRRLTRAAVLVAEQSRAELTRVADSDSPDPAPPQLASVDVDSTDEIGELAAALNRVQATAALLLERQVSTRSNNSVMFANIARRTQNLVGRQLTLIDELERSERDPELLQRLYRLDHVATRLRRSADSLLVVSGTIDQQLSGTPTRLSDVVRSALAEIEGYRAVHLGDLPDVAINADLVADLRLLLAELIENATNFSPPGSPVEVNAAVEHDLYLAVVDHGVGLSAARVDEENRRLVERERLDLAPTRVLGLFVVGRLARRHGLAVRLDPSQGRGVTATVRIPASQLAQTSRATGPPVPPGPPRPEPALGVVPPTAMEAIRAAQQNGPFPWLAEPGPMAIEAAAPASSSPTSTAPTSSPAPAGADVDQAWPGGLAGPQKSASPSPASPSPASPSPVGPPPAWPPAPATPPTPKGAPLPRRSGSAPDPAFSDDPHAVVEPSPGSIPNGPAEASRSGLSRRIPGTHLTDADVAGTEPTTRILVSRDPDAERDALNDYLSGFARGTVDPDPGADLDPSDQPSSDQELESRPTLAERHS
jgi:signal transduction histidine kinase